MWRQDVLLHQWKVVSRCNSIKEDVLNKCSSLTASRGSSVPSFSWVSTFFRIGVKFSRHFWFSLSLYLEMKMLNSITHILVIWVFHSFHSQRKVIVFLSTFSQTAVTNTYFWDCFICSIQTKIVVSSSLFRPNQLSLWEIWIKDWIWKNWNNCFW